MKKLSALFIAMTFCILSAGSAVASDSQMEILDRHAVWSDWFDENGNRLPDTIEKMNSDRSTPERASSETVKGDGMDEKGRKFDFVQETKFYDYAKDNGQET